MRALLPIAAALALLACTEPTGAPIFCDENTPCVGENDRSFCDIDGVHPPSDGLGNSCIAPPPDACNRLEPCVSAATPVCTDDSDGQCVECTESAQCEGDKPFCDRNTNTCRAVCTFGAPGDAACAALDAGAGYCGPEGGCVECLLSIHCSTAEAAVCDESSFACRGCLAHDECKSGSCDLDTGECIDLDDIIHVSKNGADADTCGDNTSSCATIGHAISRVSGSRNKILVATGDYPEKLAISSGNFSIHGKGMVVIDPDLSSSQAIVSVSGTADVRMVGLILAPGSNSGTNYGLRCNSSSASVGLHQVTIVDVKGDAFSRGIRSDNCALHVDTSTLSGSSGVGVSIFGRSVSIQRSTIRGNLGGGIIVSGADFDIANNFILDNGRDGSSGSDFGGVLFQGTEGLSETFDFNTLAGNGVDNEVLAYSSLTCSDVSLVASGNIIVTRGQGGGMGSVSPDCTIHYSLIEGDSPFAGTGNINGNPLFVDPGNGNYHIQSTSPAVDAADPAATLDIDFDGDERPMGSARDIGADEAN